MVSVCLGFNVVFNRQLKRRGCSRVYLKYLLVIELIQDLLRISLWIV